MVVPSLAVIIIILKNGKLREKNNSVFYVNLLIANVVITLVRWTITSTIIICYLLDLPNVNCNIMLMPAYTSFYGSRLMILAVVVNRLLLLVYLSHTRQQSPLLP